MKISACVLAMFVAIPAIAQEPLIHDFRGGKFDRDVLAYSGQTPEKYITPENEGLRLRYTRTGAPPSNNIAGVVWRFHARGDFVVTAKYEILKVERPEKGWTVGPEMYLRLKNANKDGVAFARGVPPNGAPQISFTYMTNAENGKRVVKHPRYQPTAERSLRGAFRLARQGTMLTASFAEADDPFEEFQRVEIGNADIDMIRFAGLSGGDPNAVLDMRMLEFQLQGKDLGYLGRDFATPAPKAVVVAPADVAVVPPRVEPAQPPAAPEPAPSGRRNLLLLVGVFFVLAVPLVLIGATVLFVRMRKRNVVASEEKSVEVNAMKKGAAKK